jgi:hypothetical protein
LKSIRPVFDIAKSALCGTSSPDISITSDYDPRCLWICFASTFSGNGSSPLPINDHYSEHNKSMLTAAVPLPLNLTKYYVAYRIEHMSYKWIRASEIAEYTYCHRAWWLKQTRGWQSGNNRQLQSGSRYHNRHGNRVRQVSLMRGLAYTMLFCVVAYVVFQLLIGV